MQKYQFFPYVHSHCTDTRYPRKPSSWRVGSGISPDLPLKVLLAVLPPSIEGYREDGAAAAR